MLEKIADDFIVVFRLIGPIIIFGVVLMTLKESNPTFVGYLFLGWLITVALKILLEK